MQTKSHNSISILIFSIAVILLFGTGCRPARLLTEEQYLLQSNRLKIDSKEIDKKEVESYFRQKPNRRTFFLFHIQLSAYNFSKRGKERKWKNWIGRVVGEEPVILDSTLMNRTNDQFLRFMNNHSYYNAQVENSVKLSKKRARVLYKIKVGVPLIINELDFVVRDSSIANLVYSDTAQSLLKIGEKFMLETLNNERSRIVLAMRDSGYFKFNPDYVRYIVDTLQNKASVIVEIDYAMEAGVGAEVLKVPHKKYWINDIFIYPDYDPQKAIRNRNDYYSTFDTINFNNNFFVYPEEQNVKPKTINKTNLIKPFSLYSQYSVNKTDEHINSLRLFRLHNIAFSKIADNDSLLNCQIRLTPFTYQNFSVNLETTNTQGNIGFGGYINFQHKNLFKGAEIFNIKVSGSYERQSSTQDREAENIFEFGSEAKLETPSFILPFKMQKFYKKYYPKTTFAISYSTRHKLDLYTRNLLSANMGYNWNGNKSFRHFIYPIDLSSVNIPKMDEAFADTIKGTYLENNYNKYFIMGPRYILTNSNSNKNKYRNYSFFRWSIEAVGNLAYLIHKNTNIKDTVKGGYYEILNTQYAQFFKTDIDYRFYNYLSQRNTLVYRAFAGFGIPYGNAEAIPFVRQYSSGGAEGMRAWLARDLGPGTYKVPDSLNMYPDQYGDIKLEFNIEYRYEISRAIKGAYFIDVGNIWTVSELDEREGGEFKLNEFYKQLAVGTGLGIRYDLGFTVLRLDAGIKVKDPSIVGDESWVLFNKPLEWNDLLFNFGIGYPF